MQKKKGENNKCSTVCCMHCLSRAQGAIALPTNNASHDGAWREQPFLTNFQCAAGNQIRRASFYVCIKSVSVHTPSPIAQPSKIFNLGHFENGFLGKP